MPMTGMVSILALLTRSLRTARLALIRSALELWGEDPTREGLFPTIRSGDARHLLSYGLPRFDFSRTTPPVKPSGSNVGVSRSASFAPTDRE